MGPDRKILLSSDIWRQTISYTKENWREWGLVAGLGLLLPQLIVNIGLDITSQQAVADLRAIFTSKPLLSGSPLPFAQLIAPAFNYFGHLAGAVLPLAFSAIASFLTLVRLSAAHLRQEPKPQIWHLWLTALKRTIPLGLALFLVGFLITLTGQIFILPALLLGVLGMMVPTIFVVEGRSALRSLVSALTLRYARGSGYSGWSVLFNLISLGAFLYGALALISLVSESMMYLDELTGLSRKPWITMLPIWEVNPFYAMVSLIESVLSVICIALMPILTTTLYFKVRLGSEGRPIAQV